MSVIRDITERDVSGAQFSAPLPGAGFRSTGSTGFPAAQRLAQDQQQRKKADAPKAKGSLFAQQMALRRAGKAMGAAGGGVSSTGAGSRMAAAAAANRSQSVNRQEVERRMMMAAAPLAPAAAAAGDESNQDEIGRENTKKVAAMSAEQIAEAQVWIIFLEFGIFSTVNCH